MNWFKNDLAFIKQKAIQATVSLEDHIFNHLNISVEDQFQILKNEQPSYAKIMKMILGSVTSFHTMFILVMAYFVFLLRYRNHIKNFYS